MAHGARDLVRIQIRRGDADAALQLCESLLPDGQAEEPPAAAALHLARAEALLALGQPAVARLAALRAQELARDSGDGAVLRDATRVLERIPVPETRDRHDERPTARALSGGSGLIEPLTARETEVFRLVAVGWTNRQIATELFVTLGTVKAHVHAICGKLGAGSRVQAIVRGRELGLLP
jgi:ATP/maltotriose-dependent transcriptional regulator MalT